jgi:hypothetical protein
MNTNSQPPSIVETSSTPSSKQPVEVSQNMMKNWLNVISDRKGLVDAGMGSAPDIALLGQGDGGLASLPDSIQAQLLQERFRQSFDAQDGAAGGELLGDIEGENKFGTATGANALDGGDLPNTSESNLGPVDAGATRAEQGATEATEFRDERFGEDLDDEDIDEILNDGGQILASSAMRENKVEPPQSLLPRDSTDYQWIEKFTDRVLVEVESRTAERNFSIQLSQDVIPNATLILSRTGGRWQLSADTDDDAAARGIVDAEQALGARFAARGLGDIQVDVGKGKQRSQANASA